MRSPAGAQKAQTTSPHARQWWVACTRHASEPLTADVNITSEPHTEQGVQPLALGIVPGAVIGTKAAGGCTGGA